jgi:hypothetical protein
MMKVNRMRLATMAAVAAAGLLASGCDVLIRKKEANFVPASEKECAAMYVVARHKLRLHSRPPNWLNGLDRDDWRPTCDWKSRGIKFQNETIKQGWGTVASGDEYTFHRPQFGTEGATVVVEEIDYGGHETLFTCRLSGYGNQWSLRDCKDNDVMPF